MRRAFFSFLILALLLVAAGAVPRPAAAELKTVVIELGGRIFAVPMDVAPGTPLEAIDVPGYRGERVIEVRDLRTVNRPADRDAPKGDGDEGAGAPDKEPPKKEEPKPQPEPETVLKPAPSEPGPEKAPARSVTKVPVKKAPVRLRSRRPARAAPSRTREPGGAPTPANPGLFDTGAANSVTGLPSFTMRHFRVPVFLLPIYQAAGTQHGVQWEVLAAINEIETDYGRNLNVSSAGAVGWMQFMPATWKAYGVDANRDGLRDPNNPVDAIFAAARYLEASGAKRDLRRAIFAYNHADWYVDSVMLRARLIAGAPPELIGSLTGLTEGRFPVSGRARYAGQGDSTERPTRPAHREGGSSRRSIDIFARAGAPVVAASDGTIKKVGRSPRLGRYLELEDVYGNRFTYADLGEITRRVAEPPVAVHPELVRAKKVVGELLGAFGVEAVRLPVASGPQSNPLLPVSALIGDIGRPWAPLVPLASLAAADPAPSAAPAEPSVPGSVRRLRKGVRVAAGTTIARVGGPARGLSPHLRFAIRPAGRGAPQIDPKPILDGWRLLEETAVYRGEGRNPLRGGEPSIGRILMMPKPLLERRVLADERIDLYGCGRRDVRAGRIDRRVLATLAYLAESGMRPTVSSLQCGHGYYTSSGNVSHHSSGNAVDISRINGVPILGHQERGGVTYSAVRRLMALQGTMRPAQIISLLELGGPTLSMADHADHIHVGFDPGFGGSRRGGRVAPMRAARWHDLIDRLGRIDQPAVPDRPSRFALER